MFDDAAVARQIAERLRVEGAVDVEVTDTRITFKGVKRADRPDLSRDSPICMVRRATLVVRQDGDGVHVTQSIVHNRRTPALLAVGIGLLVLMTAVRPNGPGAAAMIAIMLTAVAGRFVIARYRLSSWLRTLARQELSFLERRQIEDHHEPTPEP